MDNNNEIFTPFLRWAGGKTWLTKHIEKFLPENIANYYEPFLGGGAIFFYLKSHNLINGKCFLSDTNSELINVYQELKSHPQELIRLLKKHKNTEQEYYKIRNIRFTNKTERASRFLFLNRTSFNGIYRVNNNGEYNVPYGYRKLDKLYDFEKLEKLPHFFKNCFFSVKDFKQTTKHVTKDDLVFIDPPYTVAHENNGFIQYNQFLFSWENQIELSKALRQIKMNKGKFIMTNAFHSSIEKLYYNSGQKTILSRASIVGGLGANRAQYKELIYSNI